MVDERNETVIVTGSSGLIGAPVVRRLARSFRAVGFDREGNPHPPREAECVRVDIGSEQARESFIKPWMVALAEDDYELDITRARSLPGWEPQTSLRETLPKMAAALEADPPGWYRANKLDPPPWLEYVAAQAAAPERTG